MARTTAEERLAKLEEQRARLNAEISRVKARASANERKRDTRRKVLAGAMVLGQVEQGTFPKEKFLAQLDEYLERDNDREMFGLPAKAGKANSATEFSTSSRGII